MRSRWMAAIVLGAALIAGALEGRPSGAPPAAPQDGTPTRMNGIAERYVKLVLALGQHDGDYVDAYYGPPGGRRTSRA